MSTLTALQQSPNLISRNPLLQKTDILEKAIYEKCISHDSLIDQHPCIRKLALALSTGASLAASTFFFPVSLRLPLGPLFSTCNFVSYIKLDIWAIRGAVDSVLGLKSPHEIILLNNASRGKFYSSIILVTSVAIATLFQIPPSLPAFTYNGSLGLPSFIILVAGGIFVPTRSLQLSINRIFQSRNCCLNEVAKKMEMLRKETLSLVDQHQEVFKKMGYAEQIEHVNKMNLQTDDCLADAMTFVTNIFTASREQETPKKNCLSKYLAKIPGTWIAGSLWTGVAYYTFEKTKKDLIDNDYVAGSLAGTTVLLGVYFSSLSIINTTEKIMNLACQSLTCQKQKKISEQLRPKLFITLHLLGFLTDVGALGSTHVIWGDFFKDQLEERIYFETTIGLANFLFLTAATIDLVGEVVEEVIKKWGNQDEKELIGLKGKLTHLQTLLNNTSLLDLGLFINKMPVEHKMNLLTKVDLSIEQLNEWLDTPNELQEHA